MCSKLGEAQRVLRIYQRPSENARERQEKGFEYGTSCAVVVLPEISSQGLESSETQSTRRCTGRQDRGLELRAKTDKLGET